MELSHLRHGPLDIEHLVLKRDECWCIVGKNGSGKSLLAGILAGAIEPLEGEVRFSPSSREWISFENSQARYERELYLDETNISDEVDFGSTGLELLAESGRPNEEILELAGALGIEGLLARGCRQFSSGEWRRVELTRAALIGPELLVLDEPLESLDRNSREQVLALAARLRERGMQLVFFVGRLEDVAPFCDRLGVLAEGRLLASGPKAEILADPATEQLFRFDPGRIPEAPTARAERISPLIEGRGLTVRYGDLTQFSPFDWKVEPGEHTRVVGPNGSGKSTLLGLITGDHPQCYTNELSVVGFRRGTGETIWDVKKRIGIVSPALHRDYRAPATALTVVVSGFFDSVGLYKEPSRDQVRLARSWLEIFDLGHGENTPFQRLSYGQQRLVLSARALVKAPPLLVLDEPTAGLDAMNAALVLGYFGRLAQLGVTTLLFVSHRSEEQITGVERSLEFVPSVLPDTRYDVIQRSVAANNGTTKTR